MRAPARPARAVGSAIGRATMTRPGGVPEWPKGTGCKPVGSAFRGSNPLSPISSWFGSGRSGWGHDGSHTTASSLAARSFGARDDLGRLPPRRRLPVAGVAETRQQLRKRGWAADRACQARTQFFHLDRLVQERRRDAFDAGAKEHVAEGLAGGGPVARRVAVSAEHGEQRCALDELEILPRLVAAPVEASQDECAEA